MKNAKLVFWIAICSFSIQTGTAQEIDNCLKPGMILDLMHINTNPDAEREARVDFLNNVYFPAVREGLPGTVSYHVEGIGGERSGQHVKFSLHASQAIRDKYFHAEGQGLGMTEEAMKLWEAAKVKGGVTQEKVKSLFNGWDFSNFNFWKIVSAAGRQPEHCELSGLEIDMHYLVKKQDVDKEKLEKQLIKKLKSLSTNDSQLFLLYSDRGTRMGAYAILDLHASGKNCKEAIMNSDLKLDASLFSSYRIW